MRKIIAAILFCLPLLVSAQIYIIDLTTLTTNTAINWGYMTISNSASMTTNQPFRTVKSNNVIVGDPLLNAFTKVNSNFQYLAAHIGTNAQGLTNVSITTLNGLTNYAHISGSTLIIRLGNTNAGGASGIPLLNGVGTNTILVTSPSIGVTNINVINDTWLNSSNLHIFGLPPHALIPLMTSSNLPYGTVSSTADDGSIPMNDDFYAFNTPGNSGQGWMTGTIINAIPSTDGLFFVAYDFGYITTISSASFTLVSEVLSSIPPFITNTVQCSVDGTSWTSISTNVVSTATSASFDITNNFGGKFLAKAVRWTLQPTNALKIWSRNMQVYGNPENQIDSSNTLVINSPFGIGINTNSAGLFAVNINGRVNITSNLNVSSVTGNSATFGQLTAGSISSGPITASSVSADQITTGLFSAGQITAGSVSASDIGSSGAIDARIYTLSGEPLNFAAITNQSFPSVLYCTNPPGLFGPTNSATNFFGTYVKNNANGTWTNTANTSTMVPPHIYTNVLDQSAYGAPNAVYVFTNSYYSFVTNFTRNFRVDISTNIDWVQHPPTVTNLWFKGNSIYGNWNIEFVTHNMAGNTFATNYFPYVGVFTFTNTPASQTGSVIYITTNLTAATSVTVNFPVTMPSTNYGVVFCVGFTAVATPLVTQKTTTSVTTSMGLFTGTLELGIIRN